MSGGHFDYRNEDMYDWEKKVREDGNPLFANLLHDVADLLHEYDWWMSGDTPRDKWLEAWARWKEKWMKGDETTITLDSMRDQIRLMVWESLGKPENEDYERIRHELSGWL